jgi:magnesium-transporting ATPase (P-type)
MEIVPGDMVELKTGDTVPADLRFATPSVRSCKIMLTSR